MKPTCTKESFISSRRDYSDKNFETITGKVAGFDFEGSDTIGVVKKGK